MSWVKKNIIILIPGLLLTVAVAIPSVGLHWCYKPISAVAIAMLLGLFLRNAFGLPGVFSHGVGFAVTRLLKLAIILLGVRLSFVEILEIGAGSLIIVLSCITLSILLVQYISSLIKLPPRLGTLIGVGTSICGNSAIIATAPVIKAEDDEVAFAVATITFFGVMAVLFYPVAGHLLQMTDTTFGTWAGTAINDTSQVVTAGFIYSESAGNVATVVKLTRNLFMAPVIIIMGLLYNRGQAEGSRKVGFNLKNAFPFFILGFIAMAILRTAGVFPAEVVQLLKTISDFLIVVCIAGVGLNTSFKAMKNVGLKPFYMGLVASVVMGGVSFVLIKWFGIQ